MNPLINKLEIAVLRRSELLSEKLQIGLSEAKIKTILKRSQIAGVLQPLIDLYSWKNGTVLDRDLFSSRIGFFPGTVYQFTDLQFAIAHMKSFQEVAKYQKHLEAMVDCYFPAFWDGSTGWLGIDLKPSSNGRVVTIEFETENPVREAYRSFEEFLRDAIRSNEENNGLTCFT